jgi:Flp pilus assembly protein TadG
MQMLNSTHLKSTLDTLVQRTRRDQRGVAAVEFALIVPIMLALFIGSVEFSQAITVDRRVTQIASSTADLVAREKAITTAQLNQIMSIATILMQPYDTTKLTVKIISVGAKSTDNAVTKECWRYTYPSKVVVMGNNSTVYTLPTKDIIDKGGSVVVAEVEYNYSPLIFSYYMPGVTHLKDKFYLKPRVSSMISLNGSAICAVT